MEMIHFRNEKIGKDVAKALKEHKIISEEK